MSNRNSLNYDLKRGSKVVYKGTTNNLEKRAKEHAASGKEFDRIVKIGRAKTEEGARSEEKRQLEVYRKNHGGNNPEYNKTLNG